jgi:hypothetical protein
MLSKAHLFDTANHANTLGYVSFLGMRTRGGLHNVVRSRRL